MELYRENQQLPARYGRDIVRYGGSPLKYSFSEAQHNKTVTVVELGRKGDVKIDAIPQVLVRDMSEIKDPLRELLLPENYEGTNTDDYMHMTLTDEEDIKDAIGKNKNMSLTEENEISRTVSGVTLYYMYNSRADVTALVAGSGTIQATYYYNAFGPKLLP